MRKFTLTAAIAMPDASKIEFVRKFTALAKEYGEFEGSVLQPAVDVEAYVKPAQVQVDEMVAEVKRGMEAAG